MHMQENKRIGKLNRCLFHLQSLLPVKFLSESDEGLPILIKAVSAFKILVVQIFN